MSQLKNILILSGGGHSEHDISLISKNYLIETLSIYQDLKIFDVVIDNTAGSFFNSWTLFNKNDQKKLNLKLDDGISFSDFNEENVKVDYVIPCIHGYPGETGDIISLLEILEIPFFGNSSESSKVCFNKFLTKVTLESFKIPTTPFLCLKTKSYSKKEITNFFESSNQNVFLKPTNEGSSVGCYNLNNLDDLFDKIELLSNNYEILLIEKIANNRELEVAAYEFNGKIHVTFPGEVISPSKNYTFEEKYSDDSKTVIHIKAKNLDDNIVETIRNSSKQIFNVLNLKDLSRIDFFIDKDNNLYLNEVNTFPGLTPISMFPKMLEANGHHFNQFLYEKICKS